MKRLAVFLFSTLLAVSLIGCGGGSTNVAVKGPGKTIAVLPIKADSTGLSLDQSQLLQETLSWMERDMLQSLKRSRFNAVPITAEKDFKQGYLLKTTITDHRLIPKGARFLGGMMAGTDQLTARYELLEATGKTVLTWEDTQGSSRNARKVANALNRNAASKVAAFVNQAK